VKNLSLRVLLIQSFLAMAIAIVVPFTAKLEGKDIDIFSTFSYLIAGLIGIAAHQSITKVMERIAELENRPNEIRNRK